MTVDLSRLQAFVGRPSDDTPTWDDLLGEDLRAAVAELKQLRAGIEEVAGDRDGHRDRQIWAERVLAVLLAREGGATELTPAELTRADLDGSFASSRDVATGNERIEFRASGRRKAAPQQPARGEEAPWMRLELRTRREASDEEACHDCGHWLHVHREDAGCTACHCEAARAPKPLEEA